MSDEQNLEYLFHPQSIAVAGVSTDSTKINVGRRYVHNLLDCGFKGKVYPINPNGGEVDGLKIFPSIQDIPDKVDHVVSAIPARYALQLVKDCATRGVKAIQFFTAGFSEMGTDEGRQLELDVVNTARRNGIRVIGPNCMGLYCPRTGLSFGLNFPKQSGSVGLIAQSGGNSICCLREATTRGVYFSKVISYGNAADLNESDFLEYLAYDSETEIITAYIEGVRDISRFIAVLKNAARVKPVIILKAGATEIGSRTAASHTGAMAGSSRIWASLLRQAGAIQVDSLEEIIDIALLLSRIPYSHGKNIAVIGAGGGVTVQAADDCSKAGLDLPAVPAQVKQRLKDIYITDVGRIFENPLDIEPVAKSETIITTAKVIAECDRFDMLIMHVVFESGVADRSNTVRLYIDSILDLKDKIDKPVVVVLHYYITDENKLLALEMYKRLYEAGFAVYPSVRRAASAINKFVQYHQRHRTSES